MSIPKRNYLTNEHGFLNWCYLNHDATPYGLASDFRPAYFAYHAWADANDYLQTGSSTNCYTLTGANCVTRLTFDAFSMALYSGNSTWTSVKFWDTEVGVGQVGNTYDTAPTNDQQAATAAFLLGSYRHSQLPLLAPLVYLKVRRRWVICTVPWPGTAIPWISVSVRSGM